MPRLQLQFKLLLGFLGIVILPLLLVAILLPQRIARQMAERGQEELRHSAQSLVLLTRRELRDNHEQLAALTHQPFLRQLLKTAQGATATEPTATRGTTPEQAALADSLFSLRLQVPEHFPEAGERFRNLFLCDLQGRILFNLDHQGADASAGLLPDAGLLARLANNPQALTGEVKLYPEFDAAGCIILELVRDASGQPLGYLGGVATLQQLCATIAASNLGPGSYGFAVDQHGQLIAHPDPKRVLHFKLIDFEGTRALGQAMIERRTGMLAYTNSEGLPKVAAFAPVEELGWSIAMSMNEEAFYATAREVRNWILGLAAGSGLLLLLASVYITRSFREKQRALIALGQSEERFAKAFLSSPLPILITERLTGCLLMVNPAFCELLGQEESQLVGRTTLEIGLWKRSADRAQFIEMLQRRTTLFPYEIVLERSNDHQHRSLLVYAEQVDMSGRPCLLCLLHDVTEQRHAAEAQEQLHQQLLQTQKLEAIGQLAGGVAHDFNNLLAALQLQVAYVEDDPGLTEVSRSMLHEASKTIATGSSLTSQLLSFSRKRKLVMREVDLAELIRELSQMLKRLIGKQHRLELSLPAEPLLVTGEPGMLQQVLLNLVVNARDAMPDGGCIRIQARLAGSPTQIELSVIDEGVGMSEEVRARLFEPFFTTKPPGQGTGLGLSTTFRIVNDHKGHIDVESSPGKGTCFRVWLPSPSFLNTLANAATGDQGVLAEKES